MAKTEETYPQEEGLRPQGCAVRTEPAAVRPQILVKGFPADDECRRDGLFDLAWLVVERWVELLPRGLSFRDVSK